MGAEWESHLERWRASGLIDEAAAVRIREWEARLAPSTHLKWPVLIALACGALLLAAGLLLFVSAHWDEIAPGQRMALVLLLTTIFHAGGAAAAERFETLAIALHTVGTAALGAGIALAGQIYHVSEHWPGAILLWSLGAALAWLPLDTGGAGLDSGSVVAGRGMERPLALGSARRRRHLRA